MGYEYDAVVLGSGPGGDAAAQQIVMRGGRACMIEDRHLGGTCVNLGCMPSKALLASSQVLRQARRGPDLGVEFGPAKVDGPAVMARAQKMARVLRDSIRRKVDGMEGLVRISGRGRLVDPRTVEVRCEGQTRRISGRAVIIAAGSVPARPGFLPWDNPKVWTSDQALLAKDLPSSVAILGGGALGCEFATFYAEMGVPTSLVEMRGCLLPELDPEAGQVVAKSLQQAGARVLTGTKVEEVAGEGGKLTLRMAGGERIEADALLAAVGRVSAVEEIGLERVGLELEDGILPVDDQCRTKVDGVFAVGDVAEHRNHSHLAMRMGIVAGDVVMGCPNRDDRSIVPQGVYTHPEVACVGSCAAGLADDEVDEIRAGYDSSGSAFVLGHELGFVKVRVEKATGLIRGATWVGPGAVDLIHELVLAMRHGLGLREIYETIHAHPGYQEMVHSLAERWLGSHDAWTCCEGPSSNINCPG